MTALADGRLLLAVWSDSDEVLTPRFHLDLYLSAGPAVTSGFTMLARFFPAAAPLSPQAPVPGLRVAGRAGRGSRFTSSRSRTPPRPSPTRSSREETRRTSSRWTSASCLRPYRPAAPPSYRQDFLRFQDEREFETSGNWCNMDAGACAYVDSNQQLMVYSVFHFLAKIGGAGGDDPVLKCLEFQGHRLLSRRPDRGRLGRPVRAGRSGRTTIRASSGPWNASIQDTSRVFADDLPFTTTRSIRYQLPAGTSFVLHPLTDFAGGPALVLQGSGAVKEPGCARHPLYRKLRLLPTTADLRGHRASCAIVH